MKAGRLLLCILTLALTLVASHASANPAPPCSSVCTFDTPCNTRCSVWDSETQTYMNVTCAYIGVCGNL
jgi:hypothetical protein